MKILVRLLSDGSPSVVHKEYNAKELDLEFVDLSYLDAIHLDGLVEKFENTVTFRGKLTSRKQSTCARCLKQVENALEHPFELVYDSRGRDEIDTLDDIREMLILDHPIRFFCKESCAGLCPRCGVDLNEGSCHHG